jgi:hypothetical protein
LTRAFKNIVGKSEMYYSKDLREKVVKYFENHKAKEFGVGKTCIASALKEMEITIKKKRGVTRKGTRESVRSMRGQYPSMVRKG